MRLVDASPRRAQKTENFPQGKKKKTVLENTSQCRAGGEKGKSEKKSEDTRKSSKEEGEKERKKKDRIPIGDRISRLCS